MVDGVIPAAVAAPAVETAPVVAAAVTPSPAPEVKVEAPAVTALGAEPAASTIKDLVEDKPAEIKAESKVEGDKPAEVKAETKPVDVKAEGDKPAEVKADDKPVEVVQPTYDDFKLPEGFDKTNTEFTAFTEKLAKFELDSKTDHAKVQALGQEMFDQYAQAAKASSEAIAKTYNDAWEKQKAEWKESWEKDPELGGNRLNTTRNSAIKAVEGYGGTAEQKAAFRKFVDHTGVGDNPALIRLITNMQSKIDSLTNESNKMLPAKAPAFQARSKVATRYGQ